MLYQCRLSSHKGLCFFVTSSFQQIVGDVIGIHRSTCCKVVYEFSEVISQHKNAFIYLFRNEQERGVIKKGFFEMGGMSGVVGTVDCTHAKIQCPYDNEADFVNRKCVYSINVVYYRP